MYRRSVLVSAAAGAAVMLAVAGCKLQVPSAAQASAASPEQTAASGAGQAGTSGVTRAGALIIEPGGGFSPVYRLIKGARQQHRRDHVRVHRYDGGTRPGGGCEARRARHRGRAELSADSFHVRIDRIPVKRLPVHRSPEPVL